MQTFHNMPVTGEGSVRGKVMGFILFQFILIAVAALLAFHLGNYFGRDYRYVGDELVLASFWQFYAFVALGFAIIFAGGYATVKLDTKGTKIAVNPDGSITGSSVGMTYPWLSSKSTDFSFTAQDISAVDVHGKGSVLILTADGRKHKIFLSQKNGEDIKTAIQPS